MAKVKPNRPAAGGVDQRLIPRDNGMVVRMYRQGLGDCFLLAFGTSDPNRPRYVLIDCGIHSRQEEGPKRLAEVMENLVAATGGLIDVVIATHEHADHLSGFVQKGNPFLNKRIQVDQLWLAWTEKPGDLQADRLRRKHGAAREAIARALKKLEQRGQQGLAERLNGLMDFEAIAASALLPAAARRLKGKKEPSSPQLALEFLKKQAASTRYLEPGESLPLPGVAGVRAYMLGPPRAEVLLEKNLPTGGKESPKRETYLAGRAEQKSFMLAPALDQLRSNSSATDRLHDDFRHPFEANLRREFHHESRASTLRWKHPPGIPPETAALIMTRYGGKEDWRRIDDDWIAAAEELALNLDSDTNNTSLVVAFERGEVGQGDVLLFVGDAQVGNWISWTQQTYKVGTSTVTAEDLLTRTILYKVGHHASHNGTLKLDSSKKSPASPHGVPYGLELMPARLIAMIPVDRDAAQKPMPIPWNMPHLPLYRRLLEKASGRVLRSDGLKPEKEVGNVEAQVPEGPKLSTVRGLANVRWREAAETFKDGRKCPIYYDVEFGG
jgi:hypothetical protein